MSPISPRYITLTKQVNTPTLLSLKTHLVLPHKRTSERPVVLCCREINQSWQKQAENQRYLSAIRGRADGKGRIWSPLHVWGWLYPLHLRPGSYSSLGGGVAPGGQTATSWVDLINQELSVLHLDRTEILGVGGNIGSHSLEHCVKQQLFQSLPLHTGPSLNCPGETAELWQSELSWPLVRT